MLYLSSRAHFRLLNLVTLLMCYLTYPMNAEARPTGGDVAWRIAKMPTGTVLEVHMLGKREVKGQLARIDAQTFDLLVAEANRIETQRFCYLDVKSVKTIGRSSLGRGAKARRLAIGAAGFWGLLFLRLSML